MNASKIIMKNIAEEQRPHQLVQNTGEHIENLQNVDAYQEPEEVQKQKINNCFKKSIWKKIVNRLNTKFVVIDEELNIVFSSN